MFEIFSRLALRSRRIRGVLRQLGKVRDARALKLAYLLPLLISLTTASDGYASLGLLSHSTVILARSLMRLRKTACSGISGVILKMLRTRPAREWVW